jgi:glucose/mannose transport system substrate-binding protein
MLPACSGLDDSSKTGTEAKNKVEVFSWWVGPGDREGLDALIEVFKKENPGVEVINSTVAGGAGVNAKSVLAARLQIGDPPDSYQVHAGLELASDIRANRVEDLTYLYNQQQWFDKFPQGLLNALTVDGKIYSVPVNIHRSNLLWFNPKVLHAAGISAPPKTWSEFLGQVDQLRANKIVPLAIGVLWMRKHLLENVLLGELGADSYAGLWNGRTDWKSARVLEALEIYKKVLGASDVGSPAVDWQPTLDRVINGTAAYVVVGDWADAYFNRSRGLHFKEDYDVVTSPGSAGVFNFLSDTFTLTKGAAHKQAAERWLIVCGSIAGQDGFNPQKGSIPARIDSDRSKYPDYLASALADWLNPNTNVVGSLTHGVVADNAWSGQIDNALGAFIEDLDTAKFAAAVSASAPAQK